MQAALPYGRRRSDSEQPRPADGTQRGCSGPARPTRTQAAAHAAASARASRRSHCTHSATYAPGLLTSVPRGAGPCLPQCLGTSTPVHIAQRPRVRVRPGVELAGESTAAGVGVGVRTPRFVGSCSTAPRPQAAARETQGVRDTERRLQRHSRKNRRRTTKRTPGARVASACSMRAGMRRHSP